MHPSIQAAHSILSAGKTRYHELDPVMDQIGWTYVANGAFSRVYRNAGVPGKIIKVSRGDDALQAYVLYCQANPSKFLPVYEDFAEYGSGQFSRPMSIVTMDSLEGFSYSGQPGNEWPAFQSGVYSYSAWRDEAEEAEKFRVAHNCGRGPRCMEAWHEGWKMAAFFGLDARWDLHDGNVMINPATGHMQVTDPLYNDHEDNAALIAKLQHWRYLPQLSEQLELAFEAGQQVDPQVPQVPGDGILPAPALRGIPGQQVELVKGGLKTLGQKVRIMEKNWGKWVPPALKARDHYEAQIDPRFQAMRVQRIRERLLLKDTGDWYRVLSIVAERAGHIDWRGMNVQLPRRTPVRPFDLDAQLPGCTAQRVIHLTRDDIREISLYLEQRNAQPAPRAPINLDFANVEQRMLAALRRGV